MRGKELLTDGSAALQPVVKPEFRIVGRNEREVVDLEIYRRKKELQKPIGLQKFIDFLDRNYQQQNLKRDWYTLDKEVGFSMDAQMRIFEEAGENKALAVTRTKQDMLGFSLEYLRQGTVMPADYEIKEESDGTQKVVNLKYGKEILDTVSEKERKGSVKRSIGRVRDYLLGEGEGSVGIVVSPPGWTGLKTDRGEPIIYDQTQILYFQNTGNRIEETTYRTDFDQQKCRKLIERLTGTEIPSNANVEDYVGQIALIGPSAGHLAKEPEGLINIMQGIGGSAFAYGDKTWEDMRKDLRRRRELYEFDARAKEILDKFEVYVLSHDLNPLQTQKAIAGTVLRLSKFFLYDGQEDYDQGELTLKRSSYTVVYRRPVTYGQVLEEVKKLPGCEGGGNKTSVLSVTERTGTVLTKDRGYKFDDYEHGCKNCGKKPTGPCQICEPCTEDIERAEAGLE
ncbi:MAG: hypothetical protein M1268_04405 [Patescibacteria group bacterium]|nr:hypothetical protein [Patescibacteria group bacterium]